MRPVLLDGKVRTITPVVPSLGMVPPSVREFIFVCDTCRTERRYGLEGTGHPDLP